MISKFYRKMAAASAALLFVPLTMASPASAACQATSFNWGNNCSTSTASRNYSELARGAQRGIRADGALIVADGIFGNGTKSEVQEFQSANGLSDDGIVGAQTWVALYNELDVVGGTQTYTQYADNGNTHSLTWFHHGGREWKVKKWNSSSFFNMDDAWRG